MSSCLTPIYVYNKYIRKHVWSSCGHCSHCLENRRRDWVFRFMNEVKVSSLCTHLTLQYDDDHLGDNCLDVRDLKLFNKRLRSMGFKYRYYAIGEYGTKDKRKHFHVALFLKSEHDFKTLKEAIIKQWISGYIYFTKLTVRRMRYVLHYHVRPKMVDGKKTIAVQSNGIGIDWLENPQLLSYMKTRKTISIQCDDGEFYKLPRYYKKKFGIESNIDVDLPAAVVRLEKIKGKKVSLLDRNEIVNYFNSVRMCDLKNIEKYNKQGN